MNLSPAQWRALASLAVPGEQSGARSTTIGALVGAGLATVRHHHTEERYRPSRYGFTRTRWTRTRLQSDVRITDAGREALMLRAPWADKVARRCAAETIGGLVRLFALLAALAEAA